MPMPAFEPSESFGGNGSTVGRDVVGGEEAAEEDAVVKWGKDAGK